MSKTWAVQDAKAKFDEFVEASLSEGPQILTMRGVEQAVLVSIDQWRRMEKTSTLNLKDLLLTPEARSDSLIPPRQTYRRRSVPALE